MRVPCVDGGQSHQEAAAEVVKIFSENPALMEVPATADGKIMYTVSRIAMKASDVPWSMLVLWGEAAKIVAGYDTIYISSFESGSLRNFYKHFCTKYRLVPLSAKNIFHAMRDPRGILLFSADVYPDRPKAEITSLYQKSAIGSMDYWMSLCHVSDRWARLTVAEAEERARLIEKFDEEFTTVVLEDEAGNFAGAVTANSFAYDFPAEAINKKAVTPLLYTDDYERMKEIVVRTHLSSGIREIPIVNAENKVVALGQFSDSTDPVFHDRLRDFPRVFWEAVDIDVAREFFKNKRRVMISSERGPLLGFREKFSGVLDITVYSDARLDDILIGDFDLFIYGANIWPRLPGLKYEAKQLYANLLAETVRRRLEKNGISYIYLDTSSTVPDMEHRLSKSGKSIDISPFMVTGDGRHEFLVHEDVSNENVNVFGGRRKTLGIPEKFVRSVFMYGACTIFGFAGADDETIGSHLQKLINDENIPCRIVNLGNGGMNGAITNALNCLYRIMDTSFRPGDIVIHAGNTCWKESFTDCSGWRFSIGDIFCRVNLRGVPMFYDESPQHMNPDGYKMTANYLFEKLHSRLIAPASYHRHTFPPMWDEFDDTSGELGTYLTSLKEERVAAKNIGAIVMNANPFTFGHLYLVQCAADVVDFLYVFIVEEEASDFTFAERFSLARENLTVFSNVRVLPSGKYMISRVTFAEYFKKDELQGAETIHPAKDVRIFARHIAPALSIGTRFVGEEPTDTVTRRYNEAMRDILPDYGINFTEIPRLSFPGGEPVSATRVREIIRAGDLASCRRYLPPATFDFVSKNFRPLRSRLIEKINDVS